MLRQWYAQAGGQYDDVALLREAGNRVRASFGSAPEQRGRQSYQDGNLVIRRSVDEIEGRKRTSPARMSSVIDRRRAAPTERIEKEQPQISMRFQIGSLSRYQISDAVADQPNTSIFTEAATRFRVSSADSVDANIQFRDLTIRQE